MKLLNCNGLFRNALFIAVCLHATFLTPYVVLVPGERTNVFTALLTLLPMMLMAVERQCGELVTAFSWRTIVPWALLAAGLGVSALFSPAPYPATLRALVFFCPAVGGLACGYGLAQTPRARSYLFGVLTVCFAGLTISHLVFGAHPSFMGLHHHALAGVLVLLSAGPIHMAAGFGRVHRVTAIALLLAGAAVCFAAGSRFVILLPFALIPVYVLFKSVSFRRAALWLGVSAAVAGIFFVTYPDKVLRIESYESTYYRVEAFPATWEIVKRYPLLGVGIRTPRKQFLESYEPVSGMATSEDFFETLERNVTWDNQYLSLLCGVGVPLSLFYFFLVGRLLVRYLRRAWCQEFDLATEQAITFALLASVIHFAVHDGLFYPQICWFFHLLLGVGAFLPLADAMQPAVALSGAVGDGRKKKRADALSCWSVVSDRYGRALRRVSGGEPSRGEVGLPLW